MFSASELHVSKLEKLVLGLQKDLDGERQDRVAWNDEFQRKMEYSNSTKLEEAMNQISQEFHKNQREVQNDINLLKVNLQCRSQATEVNEQRQLCFAEINRLNDQFEA